MSYIDLSNLNDEHTVTVTNIRTDGFTFPFDGNNFHRQVAISAGVAILLQLSIFRYLEPTKIIKKIKK